MKIEEIQRTIVKDDNGVELMEVEEVELNETVQYQETEIRQEESTESQGLDKIDEELDEEEKYILEMLKKKLEISENLEP